MSAAATCRISRDRAREIGGRRQFLIDSMNALGTSRVFAGLASCFQSPELLLKFSALLVLRQR